MRCIPITANKTKLYLCQKILSQIFSEIIIHEQSFDLNWNMSIQHSNKIFFDFNFISFIKWVY